MLSMFRTAVSKGLQRHSVCNFVFLRCKNRSSKLEPEAKGQYLPKVSATQLETHRRSRFAQPEQAEAHQPDRFETENFDVAREFRFIYPEFLPDGSEGEARDRLVEKLERRDMMLRRTQIDIPEFYVGSILAITIADRNAPGKTSRFVGICIQRKGYGLRHTVTLRNVVDGSGVEMSYEVYNPVVQRIEVLKLEKRLDEDLLYLRDAPPEYSTVPFDFAPVPHNPDAPVPLNSLRVPLKSRPWFARWELLGYRGIANLEEQVGSHYHVLRLRNKYETARLLEPFDTMRAYRRSVDDEQVEKVYRDVRIMHDEVTEHKQRERRKQLEELKKQRK